MPCGVGTIKKDHVYLVSGASGGLGVEVVHGLLKEGARVIALVGKNAIKIKHPLLSQISTDLSVPGDLKGQLDSVYFEQNIPLAGVIHSAGMAQDSLVTKTEPEIWDAQFNVNFFSAKTISDWAIEKMLANKIGGHVIFLGSHAGIHGSAGQVAYATSKACLWGLVNEYAAQFGSAEIQFNLILPGFMRTSMTEDLPEKIVNEYLKAQSLGKFTTPQASAAFILHLLTLENISGQMFKLDSRLSF